MPHILSSWTHLKNLTGLSLAFSRLDENSFPNLMVLSNLCFLQLFKAYNGKTLCFSAHSFPRLKELQIFNAAQLNQVEIEERALGSLVTLLFSECSKLKCLPCGIEYLRALDELYLEEAADEFTEMLRLESESNECKEALKKISHIRKVNVKSTEKIFWRRIVSTKDKESTLPRL
jgi:disease resistance protein RPM1